MISLIGLFLGGIALLVLWTVWRVVDSLQNINESLRSISEDLHNLAAEKGDVGKSPLHNAAWSLRLISQILEAETHYYEKAEAKLSEENRKREAEYQEKYGERDRLNEKWARLYNAGTTTLNFEDWLNEQGIAPNW